MIAILRTRMDAVAALVPRRAAAGAMAFAAIVVIALVAPLVAPYPYAAQDLLARLEPPSDAHWFGTDNYGRDIFSRILWGARLSLLIGVGATAVGMAIGAVLGIWAGFKGGVIDLLATRLIDVLLSFPAFILCLLIIALLGPGVVELIGAIAASLIPKFARVARAATLATRHKEFIEATRTIGASDLRIMARHIVPNVIGELAVIASLWTAHALLIEASLSFLGLGVRPPIPTLGGMMMEGLNLLHEAPWLTLCPGMVIFVTVLLLNLIGDSVRDAADPLTREV